MDKTGSIETWNRKRIVFAFMVVALLGLGAYSLKNIILSKSKQFSLKSVMGINSQKDNKIKSLSDNSKSASIPLQAVIQEKLDTIKKDINGLNIVDIASSSPQVQKIINDLNSLKDYPKHEVKDICQKICGGI